MLTANSTSEIHAIDQRSDVYPQSLLDITNPPTILYARGNLDLLLEPPGVAIVGTRKATQNGLKIARRIAEFCVSQKAIVVSGLALGIDAAAHRGCMAANGKTIAVMAHGLHTAEPRANRELAFQILESGGLWVSEHPEGVPAARQYFVPRNRIQVGLSKCSIVVESEVKSGTTTHARFCVDEHHPLFAVIPANGNPLNLNSAGPVMLVREMGAIPLESKNDYARIMQTLSV